MYHQLLIQFLIIFYNIWAAPVYQARLILFENYS